MLAGNRILLVIGGGIAAFKALDLIRQLGRAGATVTPVLTRAGAEFVTPLSVSALSGQKVFQDLFDLTDEAEMGHIELSRSADLVVVARDPVRQHQRELCAVQELRHTLPVALTPVGAFGTRVGHRGAAVRRPLVSITRSASSAP